MIRIVITCLLLAGCSTNYIQAGKSEADFNRDLYECERDAAPVQNALQRERMMDRCLQVKGWRPDK